MTRTTLFFGLSMMMVGACAVGCTAPGGPDRIKTSEFPSTIPVMTNDASVVDTGVVARDFKCVPVKSSQLIPPRSTITAGVAAEPKPPTYFTEDLFGLFSSTCGACHVESTLGAFSVSESDFPTQVTQKVVDIIKSNDPAVYMPPAGGGGMPYSQRSSTDAVVQLVTLLQIWIDQGRPSDVFNLPAPSGGMAAGSGAPYAISSALGAQMTNIGTCVPDTGLVGTSDATMQTLDTFFAGTNTLPTTLDKTDLSTLDSEALAKTAVISYAPTYPLWTDNAQKMRYVRVPRGQSIVFDKTTQQFHIPPNTRFYKTFLKAVVDAKGVSGYRKIETRVIVSRPDVDMPDGTVQQTALYGTYVWNDNESQATLQNEPLRDGLPFADDIFSYITDEQKAQPIIAANPRNLVAALESAGVSRHYAIPGSERCVQCHMGSPSQSFILGFTPLQVARRATGAGGIYEPVAGDELTQLQRLIDYGVITGAASPSDILPLESSQGSRTPRTPQELNAQAYMIGNCAHCHNARGFPSVQQPLLKDVLVFLPGPGPNQGIFQFPFDKVSPIRKRGLFQDIDIPYISPSLYDMSRDEATPKYFCPDQPGGSCAAPDTDTDPNTAPPPIPTPQFVLAPWRSLVYRNVDTAYDYFDDSAPFPHMPLNSPGYDCRVSQIMGDWMVSLPGKLSDPSMFDGAIPAINQTFGPRANIDPIPYLEVKPGDPDYAQAMSDAQDRLTAYHAGYRYNFCPSTYTNDIIDPVIANEVATGIPVTSDLGESYDPSDPTKLIMPELTPIRPHYVAFDDTDPPGPWFPRRPDWQDALVTPDLATFITSATMADGLQPDQVEDLTNVIEALEHVDLTDAVRTTLTTPVPFGVWDTTVPGCNFGSVPTVSSLTDADKPHWVDIAKPDPNAPVYSESPGAAVFTTICFNCHGVNADSKGLLADEIATMTGGAARVANFRDGLFGPVAQPGANRDAVFGPVAAMLGGGVTTDTLASRYMAWMALGGTSKHLPLDVLTQVSEAPVLGKLRANIAPTGTPDMLKLGLVLCEQIATSSPDVDSLSLAEFVGRGDWNWTAHTGLIDSNGDAEMWLQLCNLNNRPIVRVPLLSGSSNGGHWGPTTSAADLTVSGYRLYWGSDGNGADLYGANPVMDHRGNLQTGLTASNYMPLCIETPTSASEKTYADQAIATFKVNGNAIPYCPDGFLQPSNLLSFTAGSVPDYVDGSKWAARGAVNAALAVFSYLDEIERDSTKRQVPYNQCNLLGASP
jgi:mono/diheme cytochrome c family protein/cytochrome c5